MARLSLGAEAAAVIAVTPSQSVDDLLIDVVSYAYQCSAEWGMLADRTTLLVFNSHWVKGRSWYILRPLSWGDVSGKSDFLNALTPDGFSARRLNQIASEQSQPDILLTPVDDALVGRLDYWRDETLRHAPDSGGRVPDVVEGWW